MSETNEIATNGAVVAVLNLLGTVIKNLLPINNRWIPAILFASGAVLNCAWLGIWSGKEIIDGLMIGGTAIGLHQATINIKPPANGNTSAAVLLTIAIVFTGCATFTTHQTDISYDSETGKPTRAVSTKATARTFFEAKSSLASFKASQTDKTQSATVGSLNQESSSSNAVNVVQAVTEAAVRAALKP